MGQSEEERRRPDILVSGATPSITCSGHLELEEEVNAMGGVLTFSATMLSLAALVATWWLL